MHKSLICTQKILILCWYSTKKKEEGTCTKILHLKNIDRANIVGRSDVFIYPIFWGRPPAMLLGYFDQLIASQFAYKEKQSSIYPEGLLKGKQVVCISTMKGPFFCLWLTLNNAQKY
jgi:FMN-dependent NADH-azoreductase